MRTTRKSLSAVLLAAALGLAACGGGDDGGGEASGGGGGGGETVTVVTSEFAFDPDDITIPADTDVTIELDNSDGGVEHDFTIDEENVQIVADPGGTAEGTVNVPAGDYTVYCSVPGHREAGMEASLTAE